MTPGEPEYVGAFSPRKPVNVRVPRLPKLSARGRKLVLGVVPLVLLIAVPYFMFLEYIRPNEFGIKEVKIGVNRGIHNAVYPPGYVLVLPFMQMIHRLPHGVQVLELTAAGGNTATAARSSESVRHEPAAKIQTSDGFYVDVDVSILYRIVDPYRVITTLGPGTRYLEQGILPKATPVLKQALGQLTTEEFYNSPLRVEKTALAQKLLHEEMQKLGMEVDQVLVRYFKYSDAIQTNIEEKKLQDQLVFTNQSKTKAATEEQMLNRVSTEGEMQVAITLEEGDAYKVLKDADKDLYTRTKRAEADLQVELAEAERTRLRNEAMQELGAERMVAMRMAEVLEGLEVVMLPTGGENDLNPLDLDGVLKLFGVEDEVAVADAQASPPPPAAAPEAPLPVPVEPTAANTTANAGGNL
jgi:regulator of protease activity HflC (stomatin/prohibitin superfamily)